MDVSALDVSTVVPVPRIAKLASLVDLCHSGETYGAHLRHHRSIFKRPRVFQFDIVYVYHGLEARFRGYDK